MVNKTSWKYYEFKIAKQTWQPGWHNHYYLQIDTTCTHEATAVPLLSTNIPTAEQGFLNHDIIKLLIMIIQ